jgi:hypothetical protein
VVIHPDFQYALLSPGTAMPGWPQPGCGVVGAEHLLQVGEQLLLQVPRGGRVHGLAGPVCDVGAGNQGVAVAGAEDLFLVGEQLPGQAQRGGRVPGLAGQATMSARVARA